MTSRNEPQADTFDKDTVCYIDGLNLYYGALKGTDYKWLDLEKLCRRLIPSDRILSIKYFTARVVDTPNNSQVAQRQDVYLRALHTLSPLLSIYYGNMQRRRKSMLMAEEKTTRVEVIENQEKQSDVNLASHLVWDASQGLYERAVVISNDSDLKGAITMVEEKANIPVMIVTTNRQGRRSIHLKGSEYRTIRTQVLADSQFPDEMTDDTGIFRKPAGW